ncbi:hypothetical protein DY126_07490 [Apilactobacillus micheneri]|nr:hypothetical protein DY126_07490 [Apilactobacillus micheneri]
MASVSELKEVELPNYRVVTRNVTLYNFLFTYVSKNISEIFSQVPNENTRIVIATYDPRLENINGSNNTVSINNISYDISDVETSDNHIRNPIILTLKKKE